MEGGFRRWRALYSRAAAAKERVHSSSPYATHTPIPLSRRPSDWGAHARTAVAAQTLHPRGEQRRVRAPAPKVIQIPVCMCACVSLYLYAALHEEGERVSGEKGCPRSMRAYRYPPRRPLRVLQRGALRLKPRRATLNDGENRPRARARARAMTSRPVSAPTSVSMRMRKTHRHAHAGGSGVDTSTSTSLSLSCAERYRHCWCTRASSFPYYNGINICAEMCECMVSISISFSFSTVEMHVCPVSIHARSSISIHLRRQVQEMHKHALVSVSAS
ncbi:hypothetical protein B0H13DRAFT_2350759 [Mycena leptocephala]|nr:hypothetical protein B0H13DRAFT_2350759 [Mycena leptocephala]